MSLLVDTCILVDVLRRRTPDQERTTTIFRNLVPDHGPVCISVITVSELLAGLRPREVADLRKLLDRTIRLPVDEPVAELGGSFLREFGPSHDVELGDALIAATSQLGGMPLWTHNRKHFPMPDLQLWGTRC